jgi:alkylhydroperoxidase family enzyme
MPAPRIAPLDPPYAPEIQDAFDKIMPPGRPPLNIFRTYARHPLLLKRVMNLGGALLKQGTLSARDREIVLHRTCARCGSAYEWGVHVAAFARPLGFTDAEIRATALGRTDDPAWTSRERLLIRLADELHDTATVSDELWASLEPNWSVEELLELISVAGFYHAIAFMTNACRMEGESFAEPFPAR